MALNVPHFDSEGRTGVTFELVKSTRERSAMMARSF
jgi:hypothetical protein